MKFILGKKIGMTQIFSDNNNVVPVTLIKAGPCFVVQVRNQEKDGYEAVQIGFEEINDNKTKKPQKGHFKKHGLEKNYRYLREFSDNKFKSGDKIDVSLFNNGEIVSISGISKGKGFQGVVKRHGFKGSPASHGTKHTLRAPGSIGSAFPQRVFKGKRMAGRMGSDRVTINGLEIINVSKEDDLLAIKGAVPGKPGTLLEIIVTKEIEAVKEEKQEKLIDDLERKEAEASAKGGPASVGKDKK
ncbi:50S ribosomal protein L3 [Patescibacteria group bacterium]|nr:50S ribosomal protein L3 [Patescibacteria group bacterium]